MIYIFTTYLGRGGQPGRILSAGGLIRAINLEELADLRTVGGGYRKIGDRFLAHVDSLGQVRWQAEDGYHLSRRVDGLGLTFGCWFDDQHDFGNSVTRAKTQANYETRWVTHDEGLPLDLYANQQPSGIVDLSRVKLVRRGVRSEGWQRYERRWLPGRCPQESHEVHLTYVVCDRPTDPASYRRLVALIEEGAVPQYLEEFQDGSRWWSELQPYRPPVTQGVPDLARFLGG